ncbi:MAG TPA: hypothetical protein VHN20_00300 [Beijerinckiaceae bacterium]|nr:hypothetical protein [Beijerinckiaceae bacterium]
MVTAGQGMLRANSEATNAVEAIASNYLIENGGDPHQALRSIVADALADLAEYERRSRRAERLLSRGFVRGQLAQGR